MHVEAQLLEGGTADIATFHHEATRTVSRQQTVRRSKPLRRLLGTRLARYAQGLLFTIALIWLCLHGATSLGYNWQWERVPELLFQQTDSGLVPGPLVLGAGVTLEIAFIALIVATILGYR